MSSTPSPSGEPALDNLLSSLRGSIATPRVYRDDLLRSARQLFDHDRVDLIATCDAEAARLHTGQTRGDGSPYIVHPRRVALIALATEPNQPFEAALIALLHDVIEDCDVPPERLARDYGSAVASGVVALTAPAVPGETRGERRDRKRHKWSGVAARGGTALTVHLADALDNLVSCRFLNEQQGAIRKVPRWIWQVEQYHLPLARRTRPELASALAAEVRWQNEHGRAAGTWADA